MTREELDAKAEAAARDAKCQRCKVVILEDPSKSGVVFGRLMVPMLGVSHTYQLCGRCGLLLRELIYPELDYDEKYQQIKSALVEEFWV